MNTVSLDDPYRAVHFDSVFFIYYIDKNLLMSLSKCLKEEMFESGLNKGFFAYFYLSIYISA